MLTSRELVYRTVEFNKPPRIPRQLWLLVWATNRYPDQLKRIQADYPDDIVHAPGFHTQVAPTEGDMFRIGTYVDEWKCIFENKQAGVHGEVKTPLIQNWDDLAKVKPPREWLSIDKDKVCEFCETTDKFVLAGCCPRPFERLQFLRGTENVMMDFALHPEKVEELLSILRQFYIENFEVWAQTPVDALMFMDDWGSQKSLLISPDMWRRFFKSMYREFVDIAHNAGKKIFMHSDGYILDIYPELIELGVDAVNSQIFCMGLDKLSQFKGKITFWGEIDRQNLLPHASTDEIAEAVNDVYTHLYHDGGVIAQAEFGPGAKPENIAAVFEAWNQISESL